MASQSPSQASTDQGVACSDSGLATLGVVCAILLVTLVGVVLGWIRTCHMKKEMLKERQAFQKVIQNCLNLCV